MFEEPRPWWTHLLEPVYRTGADIYHQAFDTGLRSPDELPVPVISVGNLVVGGTGKTPAVLGLARALLAAEMTPAILTRGYRGTRSRGVLLNGKWDGKTAAAAGESGDEPMLLSQELPGVSVVLGKHRSREGRRFLNRGTRADVFLLDDGFQHRGLKRDRDLVLLDYQKPFGNQHLLPAGPLREPPSALRRATHIIFTGGSQGTPPDAAALKAVSAVTGTPPWSRAWVAFQGLEPLGLDRTPPRLSEVKVFLVAGIARPQRFQQFLLDQGARVTSCRWFRDHHPFTRPEIQELELQARARGEVLLTTRKDAVRMTGKLDETAPWFVVKSSLELEGGWGRLVGGLGIGAG